VDIPARGVFRIRHRGIFLVKEIAAAAHVYDKRLVDAESFTTWRRWVDGPLNHKELADRALCEGLNCFSGHTFASSPPERGFPAWAYHAGTDINPPRDLVADGARVDGLLGSMLLYAPPGLVCGRRLLLLRRPGADFLPTAVPMWRKNRYWTGLAPQNDFDVCSSE